jgi:type IV pilus assembly protein PilM
MGLFGGGSSLIGIDVGASAVKIVTGKKKKSSFVVEKLVIIPIPFRSIDDRGIVNFDAVSTGVSTALSEFGQKKPKVASALRGGGIITKRITIPKIPQKEIPDQVKWEAEQVFPQDIETVLISHVILGEGGSVPGAPAGSKGWDLLLIGLREEEGIVVYDLIEAAGATVKSMDLDVFVCSDFLKGLVDMPNEESVALVDIGASATRFSVFEKGNICFVREFPVGGNAFTDAIATTMGLSFENAEALKIQEDMGIPSEAVEAIQSVLSTWKSELQQCEDVFVTQSATGSVGRWYLYGGGVKTPGLLESMRDSRYADRAFALPAAELFKGKGKGLDPALLAAWAPRLVTAAGLACRTG